jgi:uncharacterized protein (TIGR02246 family)
MNFIDLIDTDDAAIERACARLVLESAAANDRQDYESFAALFTQDGVLYRPSGEPLRGAEEIVASYRTRPSIRITRHVCTNVLITVESQERARGLTYVVLYAADGSQPPSQFGARCDSRVLIGELEDVFRRTESGWRIAERQARFVMHTS